VFLQEKITVNFISDNIKKRREHRYPLYMKERRVILSRVNQF